MKPRLRIFFSADIVGSTALKQSPAAEKKGDARTAWFQKIQGFYFECHKAFVEEYDSHAEGSADEGIVGPPPKLWKTIGDEVLFVKEITDHRQVVPIMRCWMASIDRVRPFIKKGNPRLDIKCTAWIAGFPFKNAEIAVDVGERDISKDSGDWFFEAGKALNRMYEETDYTGISVDYIGPSIDIGFRLSSFSSARRFVISVEIAFILSISNPKALVKDRVFSVHYDGDKPLKGVLGGVAYPVFWLDLSAQNSLVRFQDALAPSPTVDRDRLREYCVRFFEEFSDYTFTPFIVSSSEQHLTELPKWYLDELKALIRSFEGTASEAKNQSDANELVDDEVAEAPADEIRRFLDHIKSLQNEDGTEDD